MSVVVSILIAILMFGILIFVHELGHFAAAKWAGVRVNEFAIGMGPVILKKQKGDTQYSLRLFPMGGFVAMEGDDEESSDPHAFGRTKIYKRFVIMVAGAAMNLALGLVLVFILSNQLELFGTTIIHSFEEGATSSQWIEPGDKILRMNERRVYTSNDLFYEMMRDRDGIMDIEVQRGGDKLVLKDVQFKMEEISGVSFIYRDFRAYGVSPTFTGTIKHTFNWTASIIKQVWGSLVDLCTGRFKLNHMSGPIGITQQIGEVTATGDSLNLIYMMAMITINLGVFNLLPLPALDGGKLLFLLLEVIRRKPLNAKYEGYVHAAGFALLIGLMILVTFSDIRKLFTGGI